MLIPFLRNAKLYLAPVSHGNALKNMAPPYRKHGSVIMTHDFTYITVRDRVSGFIFGKPHQFDTFHRKIILRGKVVTGVFQKMRGPPLLFRQRLKITTCNLVHGLGLQRPIIKTHTRKKVGVPQVRGAPKNWGSPFIIWQV